MELLYIISQLILFLGFLFFILFLIYSVVEKEKKAINRAI